MPVQGKPSRQAVVGRFLKSSLGAGEQRSIKMGSPAAYDSFGSVVGVRVMKAFVSGHARQDMCQRGFHLRHVLVHFASGAASA